MVSVRPHRFVYAVAVGLAALLLAACSNGPDPNKTAEDGTPEAGASETEGGDAKGQDERPGSGNSKEPDTVELAADPAPEFEIETFDGTTFAIREELGTPVVLNFWESW